MENENHLADSDNSVTNFCLTDLKKASTSLEWKIANFQLLSFGQNFSIESSKFNSTDNGIDTGNWKLRLRSGDPNEGFLDLCLIACYQFQHVLVKAEVFITNSDGNKVNHNKSHTKMELGSENFLQFIKLSDLEPLLQKDGSLNIGCFLTVIFLKMDCQSFTHIDYDKELKKENVLSKDFQHLLEDELFSDVVLICGDGCFRSHKNILSARSSVFRAMFSHDFKENEDNSVVIKEMNKDVLQNVLFYIYCGRLPQNPTVAMALSLVEAADKYCLLDLQKLCEEFLKENISILSVCDIATMADLHGLSRLLESCIEFICIKGKDLVFSQNFEKCPHSVLQGVVKSAFGNDCFSKQTEKSDSAICHNFEPAPGSFSFATNNSNMTEENGAFAFSGLSGVKGVMTSKSNSTRRFFVALSSRQRKE